MRQLICVSEIEGPDGFTQSFSQMGVIDFKDLIRSYQDWERMLAKFGCTMKQSDSVYLSAGLLHNERGNFLFYWRVMELDVYEWAIAQKPKSYLEFNESEWMRKINGYVP